MRRWAWIVLVLGCGTSDTSGGRMSEASVESLCRSWCTLGNDGLNCEGEGEDALICLNRCKLNLINQPCQESTATWQQCMLDRACLDEFDDCGLQEATQASSECIHALEQKCESECPENDYCVQARGDCERGNFCGSECSKAGDDLARCLSDGVCVGDDAETTCVAWCKLRPGCHTWGSDEPSCVTDCLGRAANTECGADIMLNLECEMASN